MSKPPRQILQTFIDYDVMEGVATITLQRPWAGNALNWALLEQLHAAVNRAINAIDVKAIVIAATGKAFVSGADLNFFVRCLERRDIRTIVACIRASQILFAKIADSRKPTVAAVSGAAIGGGIELALACRRIIATPRACFSFPECSLSILPFSGGTYRLPDRVGMGLAKWMVYTGQILLATKALEIGLVDRLVMHAELSATAHTVAKELSVSSNLERRPEQRAHRLLEVESLFARNTVDELCAIASVDEVASANKESLAALRSLKSHSLMILRSAESLFNAGALAGCNGHAAEFALSLVPALFERREVHETLARAAGRQKQERDRPTDESSSQYRSPLN